MPEAGYLSELKCPFIEEKNMFKKVFISVALVVTVFTVIHIVLEGSEGFKRSSNFLKENPAVTEKLGEISGTTLIPMTSSFREGDREGASKYHVKVIGSKGTAEGVVSSRKTDGTWVVEKAYLILENSDIIILKQ